ncbi:YraN family protein [Sulfitobacter sp. JB4-11]|uniref:YraN family protein n=1 Tax=Sulfitobacter rhodophyticola TaxID=3238304 RepID=UPI0035149539
MMQNAVADHRRQRGHVAYHSGIAAEKRIAQDYARRGFALARERWRGKSGEIDLILRDGAGLIFVEVKKARDFDRAAESLSARQMRRLYGAAEEFLGSEPAGSLTNVRFDVALVNGRGETRIIENAFGHG